jgi:integrase
MTTDASAVIGQRVTISQFVERYATMRDLTAGAIYQYGVAARSFEWWFQQPAYVDDLVTDLVNQWIAFLHTTGMGRTTIRNRRQHFLVLWRAAHNSGLTATFPVDVRPVKVPHRAPVAWTHKQVAKLLQSAAELPGTYRRVNRPKRDAWELMIRVAWDSGLRQGDIFTLTRDQVNDAGVLVVTQSKTGRLHVCKLHSSTLAVVNRVCTKGLICPWPMTHEFFRQEFSRIVEAAGLEGSFKKLRKASASNVEASHPGAGAPHLGHVPGSKQAFLAYLDPRITGCDRPQPDELPPIENKTKKD